MVISVSGIIRSTNHSHCISHTCRYHESDRLGKPVFENHRLTNILGKTNVIKLLIKLDYHVHKPLLQYPFYCLLIFQIKSDIGKHGEHYIMLQNNHVLRKLINQLIKQVVLICQSISHHVISWHDCDDT